MGKAILSILPSPGEQGCWMPSSQLSCRLPTFHLASAPAPFAGQITLSCLQAPPQCSLTPCTPPSIPGYLSLVLKVLGCGEGGGWGWSKTTETLGPRPCPSAQGMGSGTPSCLDGEGFCVAVMHSAGANPHTGHFPRALYHHTEDTTRQKQETRHDRHLVEINNKSH